MHACVCVWLIKFMLVVFLQDKFGFKIRNHLGEQSGPSWVVPLQSSRHTCSGGGNVRTANGL